MFCDLKGVSHFVQSCFIPKVYVNGAQSALSAEMHCQLTKIHVLNYMHLEPLSESTNERQELASLIGQYIVDMWANSYVL